MTGMRELKLLSGGAAQSAYSTRSTRKTEANPQKSTFREKRSESAPSASSTRIITPANDTNLSFISGAAPDPTREISVKPDPVFPASTESAETFRPKVLEMVTANEDTAPKYVDLDPETGVITVSNATEEAFIQFWAFDVWEILASLAALFRVDISEIETDEDEIEQATKAARRLYNAAQRHPGWFGWMLSESTINGGDFLAVALFFGGKIAVIAHKINDSRKRKKALGKKSARSARSTIIMEGAHV